MKYYVFDLDGTLADHSHRLHLVGGAAEPDWEAYLTRCAGDAPIVPMIDLMRALAFTPRQPHGLKVWTGRGISAWYDTKVWMNANWVPTTDLLMRPAGDRRPGHALKRSWLEELRAGGDDVEMAFDDDPRIADMFRSEGVPCALVGDWRGGRAL